MLSTSGEFMSMAWAATHNKRLPKHCRATKRIDLQRPRRQVNLGCNAHKKELTQNAHGDEHIGNTVSMSASAYKALQSSISSDGHFAPWVADPRPWCL